jgi:hypothetical protein
VEENNFLVSLLSGTGGASAWIGASDQGVEGDWRWSSGDASFWSGLAANSGGSAVGGLYNNWNVGEPNDAGGEDFAEMQASGGWNDLPGSVTRIAIVEAVPEPGAVALLGVVAVGGLSRRNRRSA